MDWLVTLFVLVLLFIGFCIFLLVAMFVIAGAIRIWKNRQKLKGIVISDGLDESEMQLIREALLRAKASEAEEAAKEKLATTASKLAEAAKA
jgi:hypothetical protein